MLTVGLQFMNNEQIIRTLALAVLFVQVNHEPIRFYELKMSPNILYYFICYNIYAAYFKSLEIIQISNGLSSTINMQNAIIFHSGRTGHRSQSVPSFRAIFWYFLIHWQVFVKFIDEHRSDLYTFLLIDVRR